MDKNKIYEVVIKNFLIVMRERKLYHQFKKRVQSTLQAQDISDVKHPKCQVFNEAWVLNEMFHYLEHMVPQIHPQQKRDGSDFEFIVITTNCLLQKYLENSSFINSMELPRIGEDIFMRTCEKLYGKNFREEIKKLPQPTKPDLRMLSYELQSKFNVNVKDLVYDYTQAKQELGGDIDLSEIENLIISTHQLLMEAAIVKKQ